MAQAVGCAGRVTGPNRRDAVARFRRHSLCPSPPSPGKTTPVDTSRRVTNFRSMRHRPGRTWACHERGGLSLRRRIAAAAVAILTGMVGRRGRVERYRSAGRPGSHTKQPIVERRPAAGGVASRKGAGTTAVMAGGGTGTDPGTHRDDPASHRIRHPTRPPPTTPPPTTPPPTTPPPTTPPPTSPTPHITATDGSTVRTGWACERRSREPGSWFRSWTSSSCSGGRA